MANLRALVTIPTTSGEDEDTVVNNFYFRSAGLADSDFASMTDGLELFYETVKPLYSVESDFAQAEVRFYDLAQPKPRVPLDQRLLGTTGNGIGSPGPAELAIVSTHYAQRFAGMNAARTRGRVYIGPLGSAHTGNEYVSSTDQLTVKNAAIALFNASAGAPWTWIVWSQRQQDAPQTSTFPDQDVIGGWVDNAWDVQRRRGVVPTDRSVWGVAPVLLPSNSALAAAWRAEKRRDRLETQ